MATSPEPLAHHVSWRRGLTPVFVYKRYPGNYWLVLDAICEIGVYHSTAALGLESLARRTGLHRRTVQKVRERLERDGVIQLVTQSDGGRIPASQRRGAPGVANVYAMGPAVRNLPLKLPGRPYSEPAQKRAGLRLVEPAQKRAGSHPTEPAQKRAATHVLSGDIATSGVFRRRLEKEGGKGREKEHDTPTPSRSSDWCHHCQTPAGLHEEGCPRPRGEEHV